MSNPTKMSMSNQLDKNQTNTGGRKEPSESDYNGKMQSKRVLAEPEERKSHENKPALFLDRDGVIIKERHYLYEPNEVELHKGAARLIKAHKKQQQAVFIVTNQSGIGRGLFEWKDYELVTDRLIELLGIEAAPTAIYANGYGPNQGYEKWRKPNQGMLLEAYKDFKIDLAQSILVGDRLSDLMAGIKAGLKEVIHVGTGHGRNERNMVLEYIKKEHVKFSTTSIRLVDHLDQIEEGID